MKKFIAKSLFVISAIVVAASITGCDKKNTPEPTVTPQESSSPTQSESPRYLGALVLDDYYFIFGDSDATGFMFMDNGVVMVSDGKLLQYVLDGSFVTLLSDGVVDSTLRIVDDYTLEEGNYGITFSRINENAEPEVEFQSILNGKNYYLDGNINERSYVFNDDGSLIIETPVGRKNGTYIVEDDVITIVSGGQTVVLRVMDATTVKDESTGDTYTFEGALDRQLDFTGYYCQSGDPDALRLYFRRNGKVEFEFQGEQKAVGTYTIDGFIVILQLEGDTDEFLIHNSYYLQNGDGVTFIRIP